MNDSGKSLYEQWESQAYQSNGESLRKRILNQQQYLSRTWTQVVAVAVLLIILSNVLLFVSVEPEIVDKSSARVEEELGMEEYISAFESEPSYYLSQ